MPFTRRRFLRTSSRAATGLLLSPTLVGCAAPSPNASAEAEQALPGTDAGGTRKLGVALLGLGSYAKRQIAPALQLTQHCELVGLITGSPEKLPAWQKEYGIADAHCYTYDQMAKLAEDPAIDVVYVITPTATHKEFTLRAAAAGKHVWCEKPMAMTAADCDDMIAACTQAGVYLTIGYRMLHEPNTQAFIEHVRQRPYGALTAAQAKAGYAGRGPRVDNWRGQRDMGGGALYDMGVYTVNGLRYATQARPEAVVSASQELQDRANGVDLSTRYTLRFPDGYLAKGETSVIKRVNECRLTFEEGWAELRPMQPYQGVRGEASDGTVFGPPVPNQQSLQMDDDALAILQGSAPLAPGEEGRIDISIIEAILKSAANGEEIPITYS